ncbi:PCMD domain-containing protein [Sanguibacteroides sp. AM78-02pH3A]|uniref:PCMD domain-containing protein n=1 Tax=Sanguibacteroides sp. AM78-02pH3A TaxID=3002646 RepID=UPI0022E315FC|nr:PCMD domain-containing protein [Sanguibacteroides sp. AM78-02pH3A]
MRNYFILLFLTGILILNACTKVDKLSDEANITSLAVTGITPQGINIDQNNITIENNIVSIPLNYGRKLFPLTLSTEIKFSSTTDGTMSTNAQPLNLKEFTFNDVYTPQTFYLISESGVPHLAQIILIDQPNAEISDFKITNFPEDKVSTRIRDNYVRIVFKDAIEKWPIDIEAQITRIGEWKEGSDITSFHFTQPGETKHLTLVADNGDERVWNIQIVPPIENSDFELWINEGTIDVNINPIPGKGFGWATANNMFVQGTLPVSNNGGKAAQISTDIQSIGFIGDLVTAGTLFTGYFKMNISKLDDPRAMTYFGIPFINRPASLSIDVKYKPGNTLQQSVKNKDGKYVLTEAKGVDEGRIWVKLLHWNGEGELEYHDRDIPDLTVIGEGDYVLKGSDLSLRDWKNIVIPIKYTSDLEPTHISIVMTSSNKGDLFIGAKGSTLTVDNLTFKY